MELDEWADHGRRLGAIGRAVGWWIGDWLRYGNQRWGERYVRAARLTGYDAQTLMNMVYVASSYEPSQRHEKLSWTHHAEIAALEATEREALLRRAEDERLSARCLRDELRRLRRVAAAAVEDHEPREPPGSPTCVCPSCGTVIELEADGSRAEIAA
jgi:hypothetical protein